MVLFPAWDQPFSDLYTAVKAYNDVAEAAAGFDPDQVRILMEPDS